MNKTERARKAEMASLNLTVCLAHAHVLLPPAPVDFSAPHPHHGKEPTCAGEANPVQIPRLKWQTNPAFHTTRHCVEERGMNAHVIRCWPPEALVAEKSAGLASRRSARSVL